MISTRYTAFTLVEILVSLAILAMVVLSTFVIFRSSSMSWQKGETRSERYHNARIAIGKMSMEISQAVMTKDSRSRFIGEKDRISFISVVSTAGGVFGLAEIRYWLDREHKLLMRDEDIDPDYDLSTEDYSDILAEGVSELGFLYYDDSEWSNIWDSKKAGGLGIKRVLPRAVKIKITVEDKKGRETECFEVVTRLKTI